MRAALWVLWGWVLSGAVAHAQQGVVLYEQTALRPGLCAALRIQLSDVAEVTCAADAPSADLAERLRAGTEHVRAQRLRLGVLLERDPDPGRVRMYILSSQSDQAVIAIERIEDRGDPNVDRSLALKVRNAYDVVGYVNTTRAAAPMALSAALATPPSPPPATSPAPVVAVPDAVALWALLVDAGAGLALGNRARVVSSFGLGLGHVRRERRLELVLGARLYSERSAHDGAARLRMTERGAFVAGRWLWRRGRVELGALLEAQLSLVKAEGSAVDGGRHTRRLPTPLVNLGPELRVRLFASAYLRLAPSLELPLVRRRLAVEDQVLIEDRPLRGSVALSLVVLLPLRRAPESFQP